MASCCSSSAASSRSRKLSAIATKRATTRATRLANAGVRIQPKKVPAKKVPPKKVSPCRCGK